MLVRCHYVHMLSILGSMNNSRQGIDSDSVDQTSMLSCEKYIVVYLCFMVHTYYIRVHDPQQISVAFG